MNIFALSSLSEVTPLPLPSHLPPGFALFPKPSTSSSSFRICDILEAEEEKSSSNDDSLPCRPGSELSPRSPSCQSASGTSGGSPESGKKARKARTIFTDKQLAQLESTFDKHKYLSVQDRMELAQRMGLSDTQVKTWYQNRRTKWKRQATAGLDLLNDANNMAAVQSLLRSNPYWANHLGAVGGGVGAATSTCMPTLPMSSGVGPVPNLSIPTMSMPMMGDCFSIPFP